MNFMVTKGYVGSFPWIKVFKGVVILREAENSSEECFEGSITPIPPNLTGRAKRSRSASLGGGEGIFLSRWE